MAGKILIVDSIATNRIVLKVKLASAHYDVLLASDVKQAVNLARTERPGLIMADLSLPDDGIVTLCRKLQSHPELQHIPIMAIGCKPDAKGRIAALEAGALDVMMKPIDDTLLLSRVRSLIRAHNASAEWRLREDTSAALGLADPHATFAPAGHIVMISRDGGRTQAWIHALRRKIKSQISWVLPECLHTHNAASDTPHVFVLVQPEDPGEAAAMLRLIATLRANAATCHAGVLVLQTSPDTLQGAQALDLGADALMSDGYHAEELILRLESLMQRKQMDAAMRATLRTGLDAAIQDPLTGLYNRRYAMPHLARIAERAAKTGQPFAVMMIDLDHFKQINDTYGHAAGDAVLLEVAARLQNALRNSDLVARIGGEEFLMVMPGASAADAQQAAVRICNDIGAEPVDLPGRSASIPVTASIGMTVGGHKRSEDKDSSALAQVLLDRADRALYSAKMRGRNRVTFGRPAA